MTNLSRIRVIWHEWHRLIVMGAFIAAYMIGFKFWSIWKADQPIVAEYRQYLEYLSDRSPRAQAYQEAYFVAHKRSDISSRHFEHVCAMMTAHAMREGFEVIHYPDFPSSWCFDRAMHVSDFSQPP